MEILTAFIGYLKALFSNWLSLATGIGALLFTVFGLYKKDSGLLKKLFWGIAIACFFVASASVWDTEHAMVISLKSTLDQRQSKKNISIKLGEFHSRAVTLQNECVGATPPTPGKSTYELYAVWHKETYDYIKEKIGYDEARLFVDSLTVQVPFPVGIPKSNIKTWILTEQSKKRLRELMEKLPTITLAEK